MEATSTLLQAAPAHGRVRARCSAKSNETWIKHQKMTQRTTHLLKITFFSSPAIRLGSPNVDFGVTLPKK